MSETQAHTKAAQRVEADAMVQHRIGSQPAVLIPAFIAHSTRRIPARGGAGVIPYSWLTIIADHVDRMENLIKNASEGNEMTKTVRIRPEVNTASGLRKGWIKHVKGVDETKSDGYAFDGDFLTGGREVELASGAILLRVDPEGSVQKGWKSGHVFRLEDDGSLTDLTEKTLSWKLDFLTIRDIVAEALGAQGEQSPLAHVSDDDLLSEVHRRGLI